MELPLLNPLAFYPRFIPISQQIFEQLDKKSLRNCREASKLWQECIDYKILLWIQIVSIPRVLQNEDTYLHVAARHGHSKVVEILMKKTTDLHLELTRSNRL